MIKFRARSDSNRQTYWEEIEGIIAEEPHLKNVYHREIGNSNAKQIARRLSEIWLAPGWFAVFEDVVIASGKSEKEVRAQIANILPDDKKEGVHVFKYRGGKK
jgi:ribosomal silencing factor RsfS